MNDVLDKFIDDHYEEIYEGLDEQYHGELFPNDEVTLADIDLDYITDYIEKYMQEEFDKYKELYSYHLLTLDDKCKEILALQLKKGSAVKKSNSAYIADAEAAIINGSYSQIVDLIKKQKFYKFNVDKALARITDENPVSHVIAPVVVSRTDVDGIAKHILLEVVPQASDEIIHMLPLDPDNVQDLLEKCEKLGLETGGINSLGTRPDSPTTLIFGKKGTIDEHRKALKETYQENYERR